MQFALLFHPGEYNGTLQDQSSSHLSAVLEMPDRYFTARSLFVRDFFFVCVFRACVHVHTCESTLFRRFLLSTFSFSPMRWCESLVYLAMIIRSDRGRSSPRWCKLNRKEIARLLYLPARFFVRYPRIIFLSGFFCSSLLFWCVSQSGNLFVSNSNWTKLTVQNMKIANLISLRLK